MAIFTLLFISHQAFSLDREISLVLQGKGVSAQAILVEKIKKSTGQEKILHINNLLDMCMLTSDKYCANGLRVPF
jgi:hypothetical protein